MTDLGLPLRRHAPLFVASAIAASGALGSACSAPPTSPPRPDSLYEKAGTTYKVRDTTFESAGLSLGATLVVPMGAGRHPGVVLITGSGPASRFAHVHGFPLFAALAEHLASRGYATLMYDKRGVGSSGGDWRASTFDDRAADTLAAVDLLRRQPEVDPARVGVLGHSQGGWIAQLVASRQGAVSWAILLAGPAITVKAQILSDERHELESENVSAAEIDRKVGALEFQLGLLSTFKFARIHELTPIIDYDPAPAIRAIKVPVLALFGAKDRQVVPAENIPPLVQGLEAAGNTAYKTVIVPEANHLFWPAGDGSRREWKTLEKRFVSGLPDRITDWLDGIASPSASISGPGTS